MHVAGFMESNSTRPCIRDYPFIDWAEGGAAAAIWRTGITALVWAVSFSISRAP
jgi:hypothetical protein